jgi:hypothetical protein
MNFTCVFNFTWLNCHAISNISVNQIINLQSKFAGALCEWPYLFCDDSHSDAVFHLFAPIVRVHPAAPTVRVHPAALTVRVHEVPRPVRVSLQGGWVRNGIRVNWISK